ncbi:MAG: hypothetical protein R3B09_20135 [Nannocystaceae bacterium]
MQEEDDPRPRSAKARRGPGRPRGALDPGHDERRRELATAALGAVVQGGARTSLHALARATECSIPTLRHYFGDRSGVIAAALEGARALAEVHLARLADPGALDLAASVRAVADDLVTAWVRHGVGRIFSAGLCAGIFDDLAGPGYLGGVLEPTLQAFEARLRVHAGRGELDLDDDDDEAIRAAGLAFLSPLILALLHQEGLGGRRCRPLDLAAFAEDHAARFLRAYGRAPPTRPATRGRAR